MTTTITRDVQLLDPGQLIMLYKIDPTVLGGVMMYLHAGTDAGRQPITWQTLEYSPWPLEVTGFEFNGQGQLPVPRMKVANISGTVAALNLELDDMVGAKVTRLRTFARYLDGEPGADPTAGFPDDIYYIERKVSENRIMVEYELASAMDVEGVKIPLRDVRQNSCTWVYRSAECGYAGGAVATAADVATGDAGLDKCGHRVSSCRLRFGANGPLPFGGFPGCARF